MGGYSRMSFRNVMIFAAMMVLTLPSVAEVNVCKPEVGNNNRTYFGLATTNTRMICEASQPGFRPTLIQLYRNNWRLVEVVDGRNIKSGDKVVYRPPVFYLEREKPPKGFKKTWRDSEANYLE